MGTIKKGFFKFLAFMNNGEYEMIKWLVFILLIMVIAFLMLFIKYYSIDLIHIYYNKRYDYIAKQLPIYSHDGLGSVLEANNFKEVNTFPEQKLSNNTVALRYHTRAGFFGTSTTNAFVYFSKEKEYSKYLPRHILSNEKYAPIAIVFDEIVRIEDSGFSIGTRKYQNTTIHLVLYKIDLRSKEYIERYPLLVYENIHKPFGSKTTKNESLEEDIRSFIRR